MKGLSFLMMGGDWAARLRNLGSYHDPEESLPGPWESQERSLLGEKAQESIQLSAPDP